LKSQQKEPWGEYGVYLIYKDMSLSSRAWDGIIIYFFGIELELEGSGASTVFI
jgi:hypothetical protein